MRNWLIATAGLLALAACTTTASTALVSSAPVEVHLLAINDFHGNLDPPSAAACS